MKKKRKAAAGKKRVAPVATKTPAAKKRPAKKRPAKKPAANVRRSQLLAMIDDAIKADRYLVAVFRVERGEVRLDRATHQYPYAECNTALRLLKSNLDEEIREQEIRL